MNNSTCPEGKLEPTYWDRPDQYEYFKDLNILLSSTAPRSTSRPSPTSSSGSGGKSGPSGAVIGGAVGGSLGFVLIVAAVVFLLWRKRRNENRVNNDASSIEENKPEAGELASPISAGTGMSIFATSTNRSIIDDWTAPPTYSWDVHGNSSVQQHWAHNHPEVSGEDSKDSPRSPFTELHSKGSLARIAELPGAPAAKELDTPQPSQNEFGNDVAKTNGMSTALEQEPRRSIEKR